MLEAIGIGALFVLGIYAAMGEEMILHWLKVAIEKATDNRLMKYFRPALYECPICMASVWGGAAWFIMGFGFTHLLILYIVGVAGLNYVIVECYFRMRELMLSKGWIIIQECKCGGVYRIEFSGISFPGIKIKAYPGKKLWKATKRGIKLKSGKPEDLEKYLNELVG